MQIEATLHAIETALDGELEAARAAHSTALADLAQVQATFDQLAGDLVAAADTRLAMTARWRPDDPEVAGPGGSYQTLGALIADTGPTAAVTVQIAPGAQCVLEEHVDLAERSLRIVGTGPGNTDAGRGTIEVPTTANTVNTNFAGSITTRRPVEVSRTNISLGPVVNGKPRNIPGAIRPGGGVGTLDLRFPVYVKISGSDGAGLIDRGVNVFSRTTSYLLSLDGNVAITQGGAQGFHFFGSRALTLTNGGALHVGGTVGGNIFLA
ncbi:MAG: hypothetical protein ACU0CO_15020 [Shimia sp.]